LVDSVRTLMWERGYAATSPGAVLERAGVGQGSMYHYFTGKEQLATEALEVAAQQLLDDAEMALVGEGTALERLSGYLRQERDALRGCPVGRMAGDVAVIESTSLHGVLQSTFQSIRELVTSVVRAGIANGEISPSQDAAELADTVLAVVQGGYVLARAAGDTAPYERAVLGAMSLLQLAGTPRRRTEPTGTDDVSGR
jgi:TetR/AcrR family transcriptional repressor of nem operon